VRLKQLSVFRYLRQPRSATTLKKWRGEESPSVLRRRGCQVSTPLPAAFPNSVSNNVDVDRWRWRSAP
ncbi:hypothetical protein, partial [Microcystis sp. M_QC_C_20170808_M3Col]|uniref:hypothetical protein n=1 Tax=Microcystis sp. M_QC_C_20170808_M3Col TaxID=2486216 RepID=UPI0011980C10